LLLPFLAVAPTTLGQSSSVHSDQQLSVAEIVRRTSDAVVQIVVTDKAGNDLALGSGFIVSADGKIVTNFHVIKGAHSAIAKLANGSFFPVDGVLAADVDGDLVLLKVQGKGLPFLTLSSTTGLQVGDRVVAIGSPLGLEGTVSDGIVSALRSETPAKNWIQTTAPVSHGNSGGPLLDVHGNVVGVITWGVNVEKGQNLNFATPSDKVQSLLAMHEQLSSLEGIASIRTQEVEANPPDQDNSPTAVAVALPAQVPPQISHPELVVSCDPSACTHHYSDGEDFIILESPEAKLVVGVDTVTLNRHYFSLTVAVTNNGDMPINVLPSKAWIGIDTPKKDKIPSVDPHIVAEADHGVDYSTVMKLAMQANTIGKGQNVVGTIFFKADKKAETVHLIMTVGLHMFYVPLTLRTSR
jgi:S1-C subfamily serine protease